MNLMRFAPMVILCFALVACGGSLPAATSTPLSDGMNLLLVTEGQVQLKRDGWSDFYPTTFGAVLYHGDQLLLAKDAVAVVLCDNLSLWPVPANGPSGVRNGCPQPLEPALIRDTGLVGNTRGGVDSLIPYIVSPRSTNLLSGTPTLRWNSSPGASKYVIEIWEEGVGSIWKSETTATQIVYSGQPPLRPGATYLLVVKADNGKSSQAEGVKRLGFTILSYEEAMRVRAMTQKLATLKLEDEARAFAQAELYAGYGLHAEAIEELEKLTNAGSQTPAIYRRLGDLYRKVGLLRLAEARYLVAIKLAGAANDIEAEALIEAGLGEVYSAIGNPDEAVKWFNQAKGHYDSLGDAQRSSDLAQRITQLRP